MAAVILKWIVIIMATVNFGFMAFDGTRALTVGDYIRPKTGEYAGRLGPWSKIAVAIGIDPESTFMKLIFLIWGVAGLVITIGFAVNADWSWKGLVIISICSVWYLVPGTVLSILQVILLLIIKFLNK